MTNDSTKIAEHVRAVHFALIVACLAVVVTLSVATDYGAVDRALRDLDNIVRFHQSSQAWLYPYLERHLTTLRSPLTPVPGYYLDVSRYANPKDPRGLVVPRFVFAQKGRWNYARHGDKGTYTHQELRETILNISSWIRLDEGVTLRVNSLHDFRVLWNVGEMYLYLPVALRTGKVWRVRSTLISFKQ
jgi:hypothetical protein